MTFIQKQALVRRFGCECHSLFQSVSNQSNEKKGLSTCFQNTFVSLQLTRGCQLAKVYAAKVPRSLTRLLAGCLLIELTFWSQDAAASLGSIQMPLDRRKKQKLVWWHLLLCHGLLDSTLQRHCVDKIWTDFTIFCPIRIVFHFYFFILTDQSMAQSSCFATLSFDWLMWLLHPWEVNQSNKSRIFTKTQYKITYFQHLCTRGFSGSLMTF